VWCLQRILEEKTRDLEIRAKKSCSQVSCPVADCGATVGRTSAVLHMSYHQIQNHNEVPICGFCGKDGHGPPVLNKTGKNGLSPKNAASPEII